MNSSYSRVSDIKSLKADCGSVFLRTFDCFGFIVGPQNSSYVGKVISHKFSMFLPK